MNIAKRSTVSKKVPEIDTLYAYRKRHRVKFTHRHQLGTGYRYTENKAIVRAGEDEIHIYHRTVEINGVMKGLTMVTKDHRFREVQRWFNEQIKVIESDPKLVAKFTAAKSTPRNMGIKYLY